MVAAVDNWGKNPGLAMVNRIVSPGVRNVGQGLILCNSLVSAIVRRLGREGWITFTLLLFVLSHSVLVLVHLPSQIHLIVKLNEPKPVSLCVFNIYIYGSLSRKLTRNVT